MKTRVTILLLLTSTLLFSQTWEWAKSNGVPLGVVDNSWSISRDKNNNLYVTGTTFQPASGPNLGWGFNWLKKFNSSGSLLWMDTIPFVNAKNITDDSGNTYIIGISMIAKYDSNGNTVWTQYIPKTSIYGIGFLGKDLVISGATGSFTSAIGTTTLPPYFGFLAKCDKDGNWLWTFKEQYYAPYFLTISSLGKIYTAGSGTNGCVKVFDSDGNILNTFAQASDYLRGGIAVDSQENIYISSWVAEGFPVVLNSDTIKSNAGYNGMGSYIAKIKASGNIEWIKVFEGNVQSHKIITDLEDNVYLGGDILKSLKVDDIFLNDYYGNIFISKIAPTGKIYWIKTNLGENSTTANSYIGDFVLDSEANPIITGSYSKKTTFDSYLLIGDPNNYPDIFIAKIKQEQAVNNSVTPIINSNGLLIYPNPTGGALSVSYTFEKPDPAILKITNQLGQLILIKQYSEQKEIKESFELSHFARGIYFIQVQTDQTTETRKIILE